MLGEIELAELQGAYKHYKDKSKRLLKAFKKINESIVKTGAHSVGMSISVFELKGIVETALLEDEDDE